MGIKAPVSQEFLRIFFDNLRIEESIHEGNLFRQLYWQGKIVLPHLPFGSSSQVWEYKLPDGERFALVHQYTNPSAQPIGTPDPKYLRYGRLEFYLGQDP